MITNYINGIFMDRLSRASNPLSPAGFHLLPAPHVVPLNYVPGDDDEETVESGLVCKKSSEPAESGAKIDLRLLDRIDLCNLCVCLCFYSGYFIV